MVGYLTWKVLEGTYSSVNVVLRAKANENFEHAKEPEAVLHYNTAMPELHHSGAR